MKLFNIDLPITIVDMSDKKRVFVQLGQFLKNIILWEGDEYDAIGDYTQTQVEDRIKELITDINTLNSYANIPTSLREITNNIDNINLDIRLDHENYKYSIPTTQDSIIIISYFSPCNYQKPKQNLLNMVNKLIEYQHPVCVMECVMPYSDELELPQQVIHHKIYANDHSYMFLKENLYNIALQKLDYNKYIFLDGDIIFNNPSWFDDTNKLLDEYDIVQPFEYCYWTNKDGYAYSTYSQSAAKCISNKVAPLGTRYHPGFCWGATKEFLNKTQGFFDQAILGGGDMAIWLALNSYPMDNPIKYIAADMLDKPYPFFNTDLFKEWHKKVIDAQPKVGYLKNCIAYHLYHGSRKDRKYQDRFKLSPPYKNNNYPMTKNLNGIYEWDDLSCSKLIYEKYFLQRNEDN